MLLTLVQIVTLALLSAFFFTLPEVTNGRRNLAFGIAVGAGVWAIILLIGLF